MDDATHTIQDCSAWDEERGELSEVITGGITLPNIVAKMVIRREAWNAFSTFCEDVMTKKEEAEREREPERNAVRSNRKKKHTYPGSCEMSVDERQQLQRGICMGQGRKGRNR